jgi:hypothetical protein
MASFVQNDIDRSRAVKGLVLPMLARLRRCAWGRSRAKARR